MTAVRLTTFVRPLFCGPTNCQNKVLIIYRLAKANGNEARQLFELREAPLHCRHIYVTDKWICIIGEKFLLNELTLPHESSIGRQFYVNLLSNLETGKKRFDSGFN